jgi:hypothetical protein
MNINVFDKIIIKIMQYNLEFYKLKYIYELFPLSKDGATWAKGSNFLFDYF